MAPQPCCTWTGWRKGQVKKRGLRGGSCLAHGAEGWVLTPREAPARCGLRTGAPDRTLCSQVTCHSLNGRCQLKVKSNTCYCCDLYDCHR